MRKTIAALALALAGCTSYVPREEYEATREEMRRELLEQIRNDPDVIASVNSGVGILNQRYEESESRTAEKLGQFEQTLGQYGENSERAVRSSEASTRSAEALRGMVERDLAEFRSDYGTQIGEVAERAAGVISRVEGIEAAHEQGNRAYEEQVLPAHERRTQILHSLDERLRNAQTAEERRRLIDEARRALQ